MRYCGDDARELAQSFADDDPVGGDVIGAKLAAMASGSSFDDGEEGAEFAVDFEVALQHDIVRQERDGMRSKLHLIVGFAHFDGEHDRDADAGQCAQQPVQGFQKIFLERGRERRLES